MLRNGLVRIYVYDMNSSDLGPARRRWPGGGGCCVTYEMRLFVCFEIKPVETPCSPWILIDIPPFVPMRFYLIKLPAPASRYLRFPTVRGNSISHTSRARAHPEHVSATNCLRRRNIRFAPSTVIIGIPRVRLGFDRGAMRVAAGTGTLRFPYRFPDNGNGVVCHRDGRHVSGP